MRDFLVNYYGIEDEVKDLTFDTLFDWVNGGLMVVWLFLSLPFSIVLEYFRIQNSWANTGTILFVQFIFVVICQIATRILSGNARVQKYVLKQVSKSQWRFFRNRHGELDRALAHLNISK
jgi:hypothetical protein